MVYETFQFRVCAHGLYLYAYVRECAYNTIIRYFVKFILQQSLFYNIQFIDQELEQMKAPEST